MVPVLSLLLIHLILTYIWGGEVDASPCDGKLQGLLTPPQIMESCWPWVQCCTQMHYNLWL